MRILALLLIALSLTSLVGAETHVLTRAELKERGVTIRRVRFDTPGASMSIETAVGVDESRGAYQRSECIVLKQEVSAATVIEQDAEVRSGTEVARRFESEKPNSVFLVLGKEVSRSYLAFTFGAADPAKEEPLRLLIPVAALSPRPPRP